MFFETLHHSLKIRRRMHAWLQFLNEENIAAVAVGKVGGVKGVDVNIVVKSLSMTINSISASFLS